MLTNNSVPRLGLQRCVTSARFPLYPSLCVKIAQISVLTGQGTQPNYLHLRRPSITPPLETIGQPQLQLTYIKLMRLRARGPRQVTWRKIESKRFSDERIVAKGTTPKQQSLEKSEIKRNLFVLSTENVGTKNCFKKRGVVKLFNFISCSDITSLH